MTQENIQRLTLDISKELHQRLKVKAAEEGTTMKALAEKWLAEHLAAPKTGRKP